MRVTFEARLWEWDARRADTWTFVSLPAEASDEIRDRAEGRLAAGGASSP